VVEFDAPTETDDNCMGPNALKDPMCFMAPLFNLGINSYSSATFKSDKLLSTYKFDDSETTFLLLESDQWILMETKLSSNRRNISNFEFGDINQYRGAIQKCWISDSVSSTTNKRLIY
jgi:hypothetical protein